jgi:hypothetical protein
MALSWTRTKRVARNKRAVTPAISTIIMTAALVVLVLVTANFANNQLSYKMAQGEFSTNVNFMQSSGMQIDNVAWTIGRTETVDYTAKYGQVAFAPNVLTYTFQIYVGTRVSATYTFRTGMILYNMPTSTYNLGNNFFSRIVPAASGSFNQSGVSAPVCQVFERENIASYGSYARIVCVPSVRVLNSKINGESYYEFYLPSLVVGSTPYHSQSLTLTGIGVNATMPTGAITKVQITASAITSPLPLNFNSFSSSFFNFTSLTEPIPITANSVVEIFNGGVSVEIGST